MAQTPSNETSNTSATPKSPQPSQGYSPFRGYQATATTSSETAQEAQPLKDRFSQVCHPPVASSSTQSSRGDEEMIPAPELHITAASPGITRHMAHPAVYCILIDNDVNIAVHQSHQHDSTLLPHERWATHIDARGKRIMGLLYGRINSRNLTVEDIDSFDSRAPTLSYPVTVGNFDGFKFVDTRICMICKKKMKIYFFHVSNEGNYLCDDKHDGALIRPYSDNNTFGLAHNACLGSTTMSRSHFFFKLMQRRLSFREWWIITRPLLKLLLVIFTIIFVTLNSAILLYIGIMNLITNEFQFVGWVFGGIIILVVCHVRYRFVTRSVKEYWQACRGNYREYKLEFWPYSDRISQRA